MALVDLFDDVREEQLLTRRNRVERRRVNPLFHLTHLLMLVIIERVKYLI